METEIINYTPADLGKFANNFEKEILDAKKGLENSFAYLLNYLPEKPLIGENEDFQVITIGGSHLEKAIVKKVEGKIEINYFYEEDVPLFKTKEIFLETVLRQLDPKTRVLTLNFAYQLEPIIRDGAVDGKFLAGTKGHTFDGLIGEFVGQELEKYIFEKLSRKVVVTVGNDTLGLGLAGMEVDTNFDWQNSVVGIVGTGMNFGYFESQDCFANLECGNFSNFKQSFSGKIIDSLSSNYQKQLLEKEISGKYLSQHFNILANLQGLKENVTSSKDMNNLISQRNDEVRELGLKVLSHSAQLVAGVLFGLYNYKKQAGGFDSNFKLMALIEGSLFWKAYEYRQMVLENLQKLGLKKDSIFFPHLYNSGILGAAKLALGK